MEIMREILYLTCVAINIHTLTHTSYVTVSCALIME